MNRLSIAESILGAVEWNGTWGFCTCPGEHLHGSKTARKDCRILTEGAPTLYCFHGSCSSVRSDTQRAIRREIMQGVKAGTIERVKLHKPAVKVDSVTILKKQARMEFEKLQILYPWSCAQIERDSPTRPLESPVDQYHLHLGLFCSDDVVWIGSAFDSGDPVKIQNFQTVADWKRFDHPPANFICPSTFWEGTFKRSNSHVLTNRFLVVESDELNFDQVGAVFRWLREKWGLTLVTVIHSGGKSLHGWFVRPEEKVYQELKLILPEFKCDPAMFKPTQPVRLAGAWREEKQQLQRMLYYVGY